MQYKSNKQVQDGDAILECMMQLNYCFQAQDIQTIFGISKQGQSLSLEHTKDTHLRDQYDDK